MSSIPDEAWEDTPVPETDAESVGSVEWDNFQEPSELSLEELRNSLPEEAELPEGPFGRPKKVRLKDKVLPEKHGHADSTHAVRVRAAEKAGDILEKRLAGWSLREIAHVYGVSPGLIHKIIAREVARAQKKTTQSAEQIRFLMEERLDFMWKSIYPQIERGNARSVEMGLRIMERQAKLYGLDAPEKTQIEMSIDVSDSELVAQAKRIGIKVPEELEALAGGDIINAEFSLKDKVYGEIEDREPVPGDHEGPKEEAPAEEPQA